MIKLFHLKFKQDKVASGDEIKAFVCTTHPFIKILFNDYQGSLEIKISQGLGGQCLCYCTTDIYQKPKTHKEFQGILDDRINEITLNLRNNLVWLDIKSDFFNDIKSSLEVHSILN